jgi:hypothetical protein
MGVSRFFRRFWMESLYFSVALPAYRQLAREALEIVGVYSARAEWFEQKGEAHIAIEYRQLAQEAVARAQRYNSLADLAETTNKSNAEETQKREKG